MGMIYTPMTKKALALCFEAHQYQKDKSGLPYVFHPFHLAEQMTTEEEICTALLHDIVEDTDYTFEDLEEMGFSENIICALRYLTKPDGMSYLDYVERLKVNPIARKVKLADLNHNSDLNRLEHITPKDRARVEKYERAKHLLI